MSKFLIPFKISGCFTLNTYAKHSFKIGILDRTKDPQNEKIISRMKGHFSHNLHYDVELVDFEDSTKNIIIEILSLGEEDKVDCHKPNQNNPYTSELKNYEDLIRMVSGYYHDYLEDSIDSMLREERVQEFTSLAVLESSMGNHRCVGMESTWNKHECKIRNLTKWTCNQCRLVYYIKNSNLKKIVEVATK